MIRMRRALAWLPPFFVGVAAAVAAEVAVGILLYAGEGLMRSLSTVLVVEAAAFAVGLSMVPSPAPDLVEKLRRRWLMCLVAFVAAALFGTSWSVLREMGETGFSQGIGLAVMGALPLYAAGAVLAGLSGIRAADGARATVGPGIPAMFGAAVGFGMTGYLLGEAPMPSSLLIGCLVLLSLGGLLYGIVLGGRLEVEVRETRPITGGEVRVEDRRLSAKKAVARVLLEVEVPRRTTSIAGGDNAPWDLVVARAHLPSPESPWRVLLVGGGASSVPRTLLREHPLVTVDVLERSSAVVELGRTFFETDLSVGAGDRCVVWTGNLDDGVSALNGVFDLVLVDTTGLQVLGGSAGLSARTRRRLSELVSATGSLAWGPILGDEADGLPGWALAHLSRTVEPLPGSEESEAVVILTRTAAVPPLDLPGFDRREPVPQPT